MPREVPFALAFVVFVMAIVLLVSWLWDVGLSRPTAEIPEAILEIPVKPDIPQGPETPVWRRW